MRKHCKRKHWSTSPGFDPVLHAIAGARVTNKASLDALQIRELSAVESITHGRGTVQDWRDLVDVINLCFAHFGVNRVKVTKAIHRSVKASSPYAVVLLIGGE